MLEFILVLYAFLFILFGVVQVGLIVTASFYTNYANFMALRSAAVYYEPYQDEFISKRQFEHKVKYTALCALGPMERYWWKNRTDLDSMKEAMDRLKFKYREGEEQLEDGRAVWLEGRLEYDYYLIVPFVNRVISALGKKKEAEEGKPFAYDTEGLGERYPTLKLAPNDELSDGNSDPPRYHRMLIQRRWMFPIRSTRENAF